MNSKRLLLLVALCSALPLQAETLVLPAVADTSIFSAFADGNMGASPELASGTTAGAGGITRALLRFDLSSLPPNAAIDSVELILTVTKAPPGDTPIQEAPASIFGLHRTLKAWNEGSKTNQTPTSATAGEATWSSRMHQVASWGPGGGGQAGNDYLSAASATVNVNSPAGYVFGSSPGLIADIQAWVATPSSNFGWFLISQGEATPKTARRWASREASTGRPSLHIDYSIAQPPAVQPTLSGAAKTNNQIRFSFDAQANRTYTVQAVESLSTTNWGELTTFPASPAPTNHVVTDGASSTQKFYRVKTP